MNFVEFLESLREVDPVLIGAIMEGYDEIFYHGTPDTISGTRGIHVGTKLAATQALEARIGVPAEGSWDGTREYGKTLLAGKKRLAEISKERGYSVATGYNCGKVPDDNYYPIERTDYRAIYSDRTEVPFTAKPNIFSLKISGNMKNNPTKPITDTGANNQIKKVLASGKKHGYYYRNDAEDEGSISAVVPDESFVNRT